MVLLCSPLVIRDAALLHLHVRGAGHVLLEKQLWPSTLQRFKPLQWKNCTCCLQTACDYQLPSLQFALFPFPLWLSAAGCRLGFNPYTSILTSTLKLESKQRGLNSAASFGLLLVFQHLLFNKSQPGWSPLALFCHAVSIVLSLSRKNLFPAGFLKLEECRGIPLLSSACRKPQETDKWGG